MDQTHNYRVTAWWVSGQNGIARSSTAPNAIQFTVPRQFGGMEGRWSPEDLFLGAIASCFTTTFNVIAGYASFQYVDLEVEVDGTVEKRTSGYGFAEVVLRPALKVASATDVEAGLRLLNKAKTLCLISRAIETPLQFRPEVEIQKMVSLAQSPGSGSS